MTSYRIITPDAALQVTVGSDTVLEAAPTLYWSIGKPFVELRDYCQKRGWQVEPIIEGHRPQFLELDGVVYELCWNGFVITRIYRYRDGRVTDMKYDNLPEILKRLL